MVEKGFLVKQMLEVVNRQLETLQREMENTRQAAIQAPGRMVARYDSTKEEMGQLYGALTKRSLEIKETVAIINSLSKDNLVKKEKIEVGALVKIQQELPVKSDSGDFYFVLPRGNGLEIKLEEGNTVTLISPEAPLAEKMSGKKDGDIVNLPTGIFRIVEVL